MAERVEYEEYCQLYDSDLVLTSYASNDKYEMFAYVKRVGDLTLIVHLFGEDSPIVRWIPWFKENEKRIVAIGFEPSGDGLYVICHGQSAYLIPALALVNIEQDMKEAPSYIDDIILLPSPFSNDDEFTPSAFGWWVRRSVGDKTRHIAIVGSIEGQLVGFIMHTGTVLFSVTLNHSIAKIEIATKPDSSQAVITAKSGKQWRLTLVDSTNQGVKKMEDALGKVFSSLNINVVEEKGDSKQKSSKAAASMKIDISSEQRVHCKKDAKLDVLLHAIGDESKLRVYCNSVVSLCSGNVVAVQKSSSDQLFLHRLPDKSQLLAMTRSFFFITFLNHPQVFLVSRNLSLIGNDSTRTSIFNYEFNTTSLAGKLEAPVGYLQSMHVSSNRESLIALMDKTIHFMRLRCIPENLVLTAICENDNLQEAEEMSKIFGVDLEKLILEAATQKVATGQFDDAYRLFSYMPEGAVNQLLTLTFKGYYRRVLDALHNVEPNHSNKIPLNDLKVMLFAHETLKHIDDQVLIDKFRLHLASEMYDEIHAVRVLTQIQLMPEVHYLMKKRGLQQYFMPVLMSLSPSLDLNLIPGFWDVFSDSTLTESLLSRQAFALYHIRLLKKYIHSFEVKILSRLEEVYNPYQATVRNFFADVCKGDFPMQDWLETYLLVCINLSAQLKQFNGKTLGLLSYGHVWEVDQPRMPYFHNYLDGGYKHAFVITKGIAYGWGETTSGVLGTGPTTQSVGGPKAVESLLSLKKYVVSISCGGFHTIALTNDGVYTWGDNRFGQLGVPELVQSCYPVRLDMLSEFKITAIAAGHYHSLAVDDNHRVFSWGYNVHGQLGHGTIDDVFTPKIVTALSDKRIFSLSAGHCHSVFLDLFGRVWACGNNAFGQLGTKEMKKSSVPLVVYGVTRPVSMVCAGSFQTLALSADGLLYQWGRSPTLVKSVAHSARRRALLEGPQGEHDENTDHMVPKLVDTSPVKNPIVKVAVGNEHCALLTGKGTVYTWGRNADGQLGILSAVNERRTQNLLTPTLVNLDSCVVDISCGWYTTMASDADGKIWTWGVAHHLKGPRSARHVAAIDGRVSQNSKSRFFKMPENTPFIRPVPVVLNIVRHPKEPTMWARAKLPSPLIQSDWNVRMNYALETLPDYYDSRTLLDECQIVEEYSAYSKLALLSGDYCSSVTQALLSAKTDDDRELVVSVFMSIDMSFEEMKKFLAQVVIIWESEMLDFTNLETIFSEHQQKTLLPLIAISTIDKNILKPFSTTFVIHLLSDFLDYYPNTDISEFGCFDIEAILQDLENAEEFITITGDQLVGDERRTTDQERRFFSM